MQVMVQESPMLPVNPGARAGSSRLYQHCALRHCCCGSSRYVMSDSNSAVQNTECDPAQHKKYARTRRKGSGAADRSGISFQGDEDLSSLTVGIVSYTTL